MLAHGFEARERDGLIRFAMRDGRLDARLAEDDMAAHPDFAGPWERVLSPEAETAGRVRITALPWQGDVALWESESDQGYRLNGLWSAPATVGVTLGDLAAARPGIWDRGPALRVRLGRGTLASAAEAAVLAGANALAIGDGGAGLWEVVQFRDAVPVAAGVWDISMRLRGQAGTDGVMPPVWPAGSTVVLLDGAARQIAFASAERGLARNYRIGVAARGIDDQSTIRRIESFAGVGLRPYAPAHLRLSRAGEALHFGWIRRTRIDGDGWAAEEVPLGEAAEAYRLRVVKDGAILRQETVATPAWSYPAATRAADGAAGRWRFEVAQMSDRFGPGPFTGIAIDD